jgi:hypothetical protein
MRPVPGRAARRPSPWRCQACGGRRARPFGASSSPTVDRTSPSQQLDDHGHVAPVAIGSPALGVSVSPSRRPQCAERSCRWCARIRGCRPARRIRPSRRCRGSTRWRRRARPRSRRCRRRSPRAPRPSRGRTGRSRRRGRGRAREVAAIAVDAKLRSSQGARTRSRGRTSVDPACQACAGRLGVRKPVSVRCKLGAFRCKTGSLWVVRTWFGRHSRSAESRREFGAGAYDCVSSGAGTRLGHSRQDIVDGVVCVLAAGTSFPMVRRRRALVVEPSP